MLTPARRGRLRLLVRTSLHVVAIAVLQLSAQRADAEPPPGRRGDAYLELRLHPGDTGQDEVVHPGLFPSVVLGGSVAVRRDLDLGIAIAATKVSAEWENIGGLASGALEVRKRLRRPGWNAVVTGGLTFPLDRSIPAARCFPAAQPADSLVLSYGNDPGCWDRSAYRRAALHRGAWDIWMWAPDWVTVTSTARIERDQGDRVRYAIDVGAGAAIAVTDAHAGVAFIGQVAPELGYAVSPRWMVGVRAIAAGVLLDGTSPFILAVEPVAELTHEHVRVRLSVLFPFADLLNADVSPGLGGYRIVEQISLGFELATMF
jgi:hypothetical protein